MSPRAALLALALAAVGGGPLHAETPRALVLFDGTSQKAPEGKVDALNIANLMGHFGYMPVLQAIEDYPPGGMAGYEAVFVAGGSNKTRWPAPLVRDARARTTTLVWLGYGLDAFLAGPEARRCGVRVDSVRPDSPLKRVEYRGHELFRGGGMMTTLSVLDPARVRLEAEAVSPEGRRVPYILRAGSRWLVADVPFAYIGEQDRHLAFCDLLHDILGVEHAPLHRAMIRLEDVTPDDDPAEVRRVVDVFAGEGVPFQIGIVPTYVDPEARKEVRLSQRPDMVAALRYGMANGGSIVVHGATHQYRGVTPDDFEFWDGFRNGPRADDSPELVREKLQGALDELFPSEVYPIAWETPHYAASQLDYVEFARVFSVLNEETMIDGRGSQQAFPFPTTDSRGYRIVPENIGYLPAANPDPARLVANARGMLTVRDGLASAFVHGFLDARLIRDTVRGIKDLGYEFVSLRDFDCRVSADDRLVATGSGARDIKLRDSYLHQFLVGPDGQRRQETWAEKRFTGVTRASLQPGPGETLVAIGEDELPVAPPSLASRLERTLTSALARFRAPEPAREEPLPVRTSIVWKANARGTAALDQESFASVFRAYGAAPHVIPLPSLATTPLAKEEVLLVPQAAAAAMSGPEISRVSQWVREGGQLVLDGRSLLSEALGVRYPGGSVLTERVTDSVQVDLELKWRPPAVVERFRVPDPAAILTRETASRLALAASFSHGAGKVLYLGAPLDPYSRDGSSRYPFLFEHALRAFDRRQPARVRAIELYFDPGLRTDISIEDLAAQWRHMGVRVIYAAAWVFDRSYAYDYDRLIRVCHANGLLVYAWFEFPQVTPAFWKDYPEWREVAAAGKTLPSWRLAMNLAHPSCREAAVRFMTSTLSRWAWDGVNLAELSFDGRADGDTPQAVVPLNDDVRRAFRRDHGFDPIALFDRASPHYWRQDPKGWREFLAFRVDLVTELHRVFLTALRPFAAGGREVIVTALDSLEHPEVTTDNGLDSAAIAGLVRETPFTLQVEDPARAWTDPPSRYVKLARRYRAILPADARFMLDINVVPGRKIEATHLPTGLAAGTELVAAVRAARTASDRVALYGDATIRTSDLERLAYAAAERTQVTRRGLTWEVTTPSSVELAVSSEYRTFSLDGRHWPYWRPGYVLVPPGRHVVSAAKPSFRWLDTSALRPQLFQVSDPLLDMSTTNAGLAIEYDSPGPVYACFARRPARVLVESTDAAIQDGARELGGVVVLPAGHHRAQISGSRGAALVLDFTSLVSSSLIVAFGTTAIAILALLYAGIRARRLVRWAFRRVRLAR
ncbi:MAG TPA: polysaccharide deacetylase family protein [Vicinamibacteria bacterium]|nr:polysaccharide deacetylase family protein [Vicinamibacteria bacterium]